MANAEELRRSSDTAEQLFFQVELPEQFRIFLGRIASDEENLGQRHALFHLPKTNRFRARRRHIKKLVADARADGLLDGVRVRLYYGDEPFTAPLMVFGTNVTMMRVSW